MLERVSVGGGWKSVCQLWVASGPQGPIPVCPTMYSFSYLLGCHQLLQLLHMTPSPFQRATGPSSLNMGQSPRHPPCPSTHISTFCVHTPRPHTLYNETAQCCGFSPSVRPGAGISPL